MIFIWFSSPAWLGGRGLERLGLSAPGGAPSPSAAPGLGREGGQSRSYLLRQPQQPDHSVAPTELDVSTVAWTGMRLHP